MPPMDGVAVCAVAAYLLLTWISGCHAQLVPEFDQNLYNLSINQNALQGSAVLTPDCTYSGQVTFEIEQFSDTAFLDIDSSTGEISLTVNALDVEVKVHTVSIRCSDALDPSKSDLAILTISRIDENEYVPVFLTSDPLRLTVFEDREFSQAIFTVEATDDDQGYLGDITYEIQSGLDIPFEVDSESGGLNIQSSLDYEVTSLYQFIVAAVNPPVVASGLVLSSQILVSVEVVNLNDRSPEFTSENYQISIHETAPDLGYTTPSPGFFSVECTDLDSPPSDITYVISEVDPGPFELDSQTGELSITEDLDYETQTSYSFQVTCSDTGSPSFTATSLVDVTVLPVNEVRPVVSVSNTLLFVTESLALGTIILSPNQMEGLTYYSVTDSDSGPDGTITVSLIEDNTGSLAINSTAGTVYLLHELDTDNSLTTFFRFTIVACDIDPPDDVCIDESSISVRIFVFAAADELPEFSQSNYSAFPSETLPPGSEILQATCEDRDSGVGAFSGIFLVNSTAEVSTTFSVDTATGVISTLISLDYEAVQDYSFTIECLDTVGERALAAVFIEVQAENDNIPEFISSSYVFELSRTTPPFEYPVGEVLATDADFGPGRDIEYTIDANEYLAVSSSGIIELIASIADHPSDNVSVYVYASDGNFSDSALVVVVLTEGNFNSPQFVGTAQTVLVSELTPVGTVIVDVLCTDEDSGSNANITYSITNGNTDESFSIDPTTGELESAGVLVLPDGFEEERYLLQVECRDNGLPVLTDITIVHVRVYQVSSSPMIANETIIAFITENATINEQVIKIEDANLDSQNLRFELANESNPGTFIIDPSSGVVLVAAALDREEIAVYQMTVVVTEVVTGIGPERSDSATLVIYVRDANDNPPTCDISMHTATVPETLPIGSMVLQLSCSDPDVQENGELDYYFQEESGFSGMLEDLLSINSSGVVTLESSLSSISTNVIDTTVTVSDRGQPAMSTNYQITVFVIAANRFAPVITNLPATITVSEATDLYEFVFTVQATDEDHGTFGQVVYSTVDSQSPFEVLSSTGAVVLTEKLDFYEQSQHSLNITASDTDFTVSETLTILVLDANEFSPQCTSTFLSVNILEGLPPNTTLSVQFSCSDEDQGPNGEIAFNILSGNVDSSFEIYPSGEMVAAKTLDFEAIQSYELEVEITDLGSPQAYSISGTVSVTVLAANEFAPEFESSAYNATIFENLHLGTSILNVAAVDADSSEHPDGQIDYMICDGDSSLFTMTSMGDILVAGIIDREEDPDHLLIICASDRGQPSRTGSAIVLIDIADVDDSPPQFEESVYVSTLEHVPGDTAPLNISVACFDSDIGENAAVSYSLDQLTSDSQFFTINSTTGVIHARGGITLSRTYIFTAVCTGPPPLSLFDTAVVGVQVAIETSITFHPSSIYNVTIPENTTPFSSILNINASSPSEESLTYILQGYTSVFSIDSTTGKLLLVSQLDYESVPSYIFTVQVSDGISSREALVEVLVENVNDVAPVISSIPVAITLNESVSTGVIATYNCSDSEEGPLGQVSFFVNSGDPDGIFSLSSAGLLELSRSLDYEETQVYGLEIVCVDGGEPPLSANILVPIAVLPVNDNPPEFMDSITHFTITENLQVTSEVGTIQATDADLPPHNSLNYSILFGNENGHFEISSTTGVLTLVRSLDYEDGTQIVLLVQADDSGGETSPDFPVLSSMTNVVINIEDYNDNAPEFSQPTYVGEVDENVLPGTVVAFDSEISCEDADSGANGDVLLVSDDDVPFSIQPKSGVVTVQGELSQGVYYWTVICQDSGFPKLTSQANIIISVTEINDFGPQFNLSLYHFQIEESSSPGTEVGRVSAVDYDLGQHAVLTYEFINSTNLDFSVDSSTGVIYLLVPLDYETGPRVYVLEATATDTEGLQDTSTVIVDVLNTDDNLPAFTQSTYFTSIPENSPPASVVGQVICTDADDQADSIPVTYQLVSPEVPFWMNSGIITVSGDIDVETVSMYSLDIACNDSAGNTARAVISVGVQPLNEFPPVFTVTEYSIEIPENLLIGQRIVQVNATDNDEVQYNDITFSFVSGNEEGRFEIDPTSGVITVTQSIDREEEDTYRLVVQAQNVISPTDTSGSQPLSATATLTVTIEDINDNSPVLLPSEVTAFLPENADGTIAEFVCNDADAGANGAVNFSIASVSDTFSISNGGVLTVTEFSGTDTVVQVTCTDSGDPPQSTTALATVRGTTMNDHSPTFPQASYTVQILETMPVGEEIDCFLATDSDNPDTPDGIIQYSLVPFSLGGDTKERFSIHDDSGCIFVSLALNANVSTTYTYYIVATDGGQPPLSANTTLVITVLDIVRVPPVFTGGPYTRIVSEGAAGGTFISATSCTDMDETDEITYTIVAGSDSSLFSINSATGVVSLAVDSILDYETAVAHTLELKCSDSFGLSDTSILFVTVTPVNEYTPSFQSITTEILEHSISGTLVTKLEWTDADAGPDGEISFNITSGNVNNAFFVTSDGRVLVSGDTNREYQDTYLLEIEITDLSTIPDERRTSRNFVNITLTDINDNRPFFVDDPYSPEPLQGNEPLGHVIGAVQCKDNDAGENALISYQISGGSESNFFAIDTESGEISITGDLETRETDVFSFLVECHDAGVVELTSTSLVTISVVEVNLNTPVFVNAPYHVAVPENTPPTTSLLTVHANDSDAGASGRSEYFIQNDYEGHFAVDQSTGEISLLEYLDFEMTPYYLLIIEAVDGTTDSQVRFTATTNVSIEVLPVNEHVPFCPQLQYQALINESTVGIVVDLECTDDDSGSDGELRYTFLSGNDAGFFQVSSTGNIFVPSPISPGEAMEQFYLTVQVQDSGSSVLQTQVVITVVYLFADSGTPTFNESLYHFNVSELTNVGCVIATVLASDPDPGLQGQLTYSISGSESFRVSANTGQIYVYSQLDYEVSMQEQFTLLAQDSDPMSPRTGSTTVVISIWNEDDTIPQCPLQTYTASLRSNAQFNDTVFTLGCGDDDGRSLSFQLAGTTRKRQTDSFAVENTTGRVYVAAPLLPSTTDVDKVLVSDSSGATTEITFVVEVTFANIEAPVFTQNEYVVNMEENTVLLTVIGAVLANDADSAYMSYNLVHPELFPHFYLHPRTGELFLIKSLDYEDQTLFSFVIQVVDEGGHDGSNVLSDTAVITVNVLNSNDNAPQFSSGGIFSTTVNQSTPVGTPVISFTCTDKDAAPFAAPTVTSEGFAGIPFSLQSLGDEHMVIVSQDINISSHYLINVSCYDAGGLSTEGQIIMFVPDVNAPKFSMPLYQWALSENEILGTAFMEIEASLGTANASEITYSIIEGNEQNIFYIHPSTGVITLVGSLDYETQQTHTLIITAADSSDSTSSILLIVQVEDENDHLPLIDPSTVVQAQQNAPVGHPLGTVQCADSDTNPNATRNEITLAQSSNRFTVTEDGVIRTKSGLDDTPVYVLTVRCRDTTDTSMLSVGIVTIEVQYINQYTPEFELSSYAFVLKEDVPAPSTVAIVQATDRDQGSYGELRYSIAGGNTELFYIETETGTLGLLSPLDYEEQASYVLTVEAIDGGPTTSDDSLRMTGTAVVTIIVEDTNDNSPVPNQLSYVQTIDSDHPLFTSVLNVSCTDKDTGGLISYTISPSQEDFVVDSSGSVLLTGEQKGASFTSFYIVCSDGGVPVLSSSSSVTITVNDLEFPVPVFTATQYHAAILETHAVFSMVTAISATAPNGSYDIVYDLEDGNGTTYFFIDSETGVVFLFNSLDASQQSEYTLVVRASDSRRPTLFSFSLILIEVLRVNTNPPSFSSSLYLARVPEGTAPGTLVAQVQCTDTDADADITYSIANSPADPIFTLLGYSGVIILADEIDYENDMLYTLEVTCSDGGDTPLSAEATVRVEVLPVNEFLPQFLEPIYHLTVAENSFGILLGRVKAQDEDAGSQGELTYQLLGSSSISPVIVEPFTGDVLASNLDYETQSRWNLTVVAQDGEGFEASVPVVVTVTNLNDIFPLLSPLVSTISIPHDSSTDLPIEQYSCTDEDADNRTISISSGSAELFLLNAFNQLVWIGNAMELSSGSVFSITIECQSVQVTQENVSSVQTAEAHAIVTIQGVLIVSPQFSEDIYNTTIPESTDVGSPILTVYASSSGADIVYDLLGDSLQLPFIINGTTGVVYLVSELNHENTPRYVFTARTTDTLSGLADLALVSVTVTDANDNQPYILPTLHTIILPEDYPTVAVATFACTDDDLGTFGETQFRIIGGNDEQTFNITSTGIVELVGTLDLEMVDNYNVSIACVDAGDPPLLGIASLLVSVTGVNEFAPQFENVSYGVVVLETLDAGEVIASLTATDGDSGVDGDVNYAIVSASDVGFFTIDHEGRIRTTTQSLNATEEALIHLTVEAFDPGSKSSRIQVNISVVDVNEPPVFAGGPNFLVLTTSNTTAGSLIMPILCFDTDTGQKSVLSLEMVGNFSGLDVYLQTAEIATGEGRVEGGIVANSSLLPGSYELFLRCSDSGNPPLSSEATVTIRVEGVNSPPFFLSSTLTIPITEDAEIGASLTTITAVDNETEVIYKTTGGTGLGTFGIDPITGVLSLVLPLDHETTPTYTLTVTAEDLSPDSLSVSMEINIQVENINDQQPVLSPPGFQIITLSENTDPVFNIKRYTCTDADGGSTELSVTPPYDGSTTSPFDIAADGTVQLMRALDFEQKSVYIVTVTCTDEPIHSSDGSLQSSLDLTIHVTPVNNYAPVFISPGTFGVSEATQVGEVVATLQAIDQDNRGQITYSSSSHTIVFLVDQTSGDITLIQELDYESTQLYTLTIEASDNDNTLGIVQPKTTSQIIFIQVTDTNDNAPRFNQTLYLGSVLENQNSSFALQVSASDIDNGANGDFNYSLNSTAEFSINPRSGVIVTTEPLDYESTASYTFLVFATDFGSPAQSSSAAIIVSVEDENDVPPSFNLPVYTATITELSQPGQEVLEYSVTDPDTVGSLVYQVVTTDPVITELFGIEQDTGTLVLNASISSVSFTPRYEFTVKVSDGSASDTATTVIYVEIVSSTLVVFEENVEGLSFDVRGFLLQKDYDISIGANYSIVKGNEEGDFILSSGGVLLPQDALDRELTPQYVLTVQVVDVNASESVNLTITVRVSDQNDNPPVFTSSLYTFNITEATYAIMTLIGTVVASDSDELGTTNSQIEYSFIGATPTFVSMDHETGELFVQGSVDREIQSSYSISVRANDLGGPSSLVSTTQVQLVIADVNDNDPQFVPLGVTQFVVEVEEGSPVGTEIDLITAVFSGGAEVALSAFEYYDPDATGEVMSEIINDRQSNLTFRLKGVNGSAGEQRLETLTVATLDDNGTILWISLRDEPVDVETNLIMTTVFVIVTEKVILPPTPTVNATTPTTDGSDSSESQFTTVAIASMVVITVLIVVLVICCICITLLWYHNRSKKETYEVQTYSGCNPLETGTPYRNRGARPYSECSGSDSGSDNELPEKPPLPDTSGPPTLESVPRRTSVARIPTNLSGSNVYSRYPLPPGTSASQGMASQGMGFSQGFALQGYGLSQGLPQDLSQPANLSLSQSYSLSQAHDFPHHHSLSHVQDLPEGSQSESIQEVSTQF